MAMHPPLRAIDQALLDTGTVRIGLFRRPLEHPAFRDSGPIENDGLFVFPRRAVVIRHSGGRFVADANVTAMYNRGQEYTREALTPDGDRCDWYALADEVVRDAVRVWDPRTADSARPLRMSHAPTPARTYLLQRRLFTAVSAGSVDALDAEETVLAIVGQVLASAYGAAGRTELRAATRERISDACGMLGERLGSRLTLGEVAARLGISAFHLCRLFRAATGLTLHAYRTQLRVRAALERLEEGDDLTRVALDCGFSSHSHFTAVFRGIFGPAPSRVRARIGMPLDTTNTRPE